MQYYSGRVREIQKDLVTELLLLGWRSQLK